MNRKLITFILVMIPITSQPAAVRDVSVLQSPIQEQSNDASTSNTQINRSSNLKTDEDFEAYAILNKAEDITTSTDSNYRQFLKQNQTTEANLFQNVLNKVTDSDIFMWHDLTSSVQDVNESLNAINRWASNLINTKPDTMKLSTISFREKNLLPETVSVKSVIGQQGNLDKLESESQDMPEISINNGATDVIDIITSPLRLLKLIAENFILIIMGITFLMGFKLTGTYYSEKAKQRQLRTKNRRKRSIDGFIK